MASSWYSQHPHPWEIAWNLPSDKSHAKSNFIFFLMAYLPAGGGQMRIHFSPIPNFSVASQEINPILWDVRLSLLGKALGWHRGHGVKIHGRAVLEPRPSLSAVNAPGLGHFGLEIHNHRIVLVGKDLWNHRVQAMPSHQPRGLSAMSSHSWTPAGMGTPDLSGRSLQMFKTPFHEEIRADVPPECAMAQLDAVPSKPATLSHWHTPSRGLTNSRFISQQFHLDFQGVG